MRLQSTIKNWSVHVTPSTVSVPTTPMSVGPVEMDPMEIDPVGMGPAAMGLGPMVPNLPDFRPTTITSLKSSLRKTYKTWKETRLVSLNYSTQVGCSAMMDNKRSGGRRKVLRCCSALSKKKRNNNDGPNCPHYFVE